MPDIDLLAKCAAILQYDDRPYSPPDPQRLAESCEQGGTRLCGQELLAARLDMALAGLMRELADDFFWDDLFAHRCAATVEILAAARVFLDSRELGRTDAEERVRLLSAEAEAVLTEWALLLPDVRQNQTMLYAAEEPASLL